MEKYEPLYFQYLKKNEKKYLSWSFPIEILVSDHTCADQYLTKNVHVVCADYLTIPFSGSF